MKLKYILYIVLAVGLGTLVYYRITKNKELAKEGNSKGPMNATATVDGIVLTPQKFANTILVSGSIAANEQVQLRSQISGIITHIYFQEGSKVSQGQALVKIDDTELQAQLSELQVRVDLAAENEKRASQLLKKEGISKEEYDITLSTLRSLQAQEKIIQAQVAKTIIKAPFNGVIGLRNVSIGEYLSADIIIANLVNINPIKITFSVPEKYASSMKTNTKVSFTIAGNTKKFTATVYAVEPEIEAATRTLQLRAKASNEQGELVPGSFATIELPLSVLPDALLIPTEAVIPIQDGKKVFIAENGKAKEALIETSSRTDKNILVLSGLKAGDTVLTSGVMSLKAGTNVRVKLPTTDQK